MKQRISTPIIAALLLMLPLSLMAQTDSSTQNKEESVIVDGKKIRVIIKEKEVIREAPDGMDSIVEREVESIEVKIKQLEEELENIEIEIEEVEEPEKPELVKTDWFNMQLGFNNVLNSSDALEMPMGYENMSISSGKSVNFQLHIVQQALNLYKENVRLIYGVGIDFNNYRFEKDVLLGKDSTGVLSTYLNPDIEYKKDKLVTQYLTVPLMLNLRFGHDEDKMFNISFGPNLGYLIGSHQKLKWNEHGNQKSKIKDDFNLTKYRIGYELQFGYSNFILFAKYYPESMFKSGLGPDLRTVSAGVLIGSI